MMNAYGVFRKALIYLILNLVLILAIRFEIFLYQEKINQEWFIILVFIFFVLFRLTIILWWLSSLQFIYLTIQFIREGKMILRWRTPFYLLFPSISLFLPWFLLYWLAGNYFL